MNEATAEPCVGRVVTAFHEDDATSATKATELGHVEHVRALYEAIGRNDYVLVEAAFAEDIIFEILGPDCVPYTGRAVGRHEVAATIRANLDMVQDMYPEVERVVAQGDLVIVLGHEHCRFKRDGELVHLRWSQLFQYRDGLIHSFRVYFCGGPVTEPGYSALSA